MEQSTFDEKALRHRLSDDQELMTDVIRMFLEDLPVRLVAIEAALAEGNAKTLRAAAHVLKGSSGSLSADALFEAVSVLESIGAESRMDAAPEAWRRVSIEAIQITEVLRRLFPEAATPASYSLAKSSGGSGRLK
jgi:two-component system sensor histidine kinase/response regulator